MENEVENRKKLKKRIQELYRLRSAVSHGGKKNVYEADVTELQVIVGGLIMNLIDKLNDFNDHKALFDWIESQKLG